MPKAKVRVAVVFGGRSAEHEISLLSARFVVHALDRERFEPVLLGIDKAGRWRLQQEALLLAASRDPRLVKLDSAMPSVTLAAHPASHGEMALSLEGHSGRPIDVVFPVLHGPMGEDGSVQGLLELSGLPYVGAGVLGSAVGMDKDVMKRLLRVAGLPIVPHVTIRRHEWDRDARAVLGICAKDIGLPAFVKPANLGSSVGVGRATTEGQLTEAVARAFDFDTKVLVERGVPSAREIECAVLGNDDPLASVPGEIVVDHPDGFYSYAAKYLDENGSSIAIPAKLSAEETANVQRLAVETFRALECAGMARVDFFMSDGGELYVNEINTIPGFTAISMYPKLWEASGIGAKELVSRLIELALERAERRGRLRTSA